MLKTKRISKAMAVFFSMLLTIGLIASTFATASASTTIPAGSTGSLTIKKLYLDTGLTESEFNNLSVEKQSDYVKADDGLYYEKATDATYVIYKVADLIQDTDTTTGDVTIWYKDRLGNAVDVAGLGSASAYDLTGLTPITGTLTEGYIRTFSNLSLGLYIAVETGLPAGVANKNHFFVEVPMTIEDASGNATWNLDVVAWPKNAKNNMTITKDYVSGGVIDTSTGSGQDNITASLGDIIKYEVEATVPSDYKTGAVYNYSGYHIVDVASKYLEVLDNTSVGGTAYNIDVKLNGVSLSKGTDYTVEQETDAAGVTTTTIIFTDTGLEKLDNDDVITVSYYAQIAAAFDTGDTTTNSVTNKAFINYWPADKDPDVDDPGKITPTDPDPEVYLYSYQFRKVDQDGAPLGGATFVLMNSSNKYLAYNTTDGWYESDSITPNCKFTSGTNGLVKFDRIEYGNYTVVEIAAPDGYTLLKDIIAIEINADTTAKAAAATPYSIQIVNKLNSTIDLPQTGGSGIYLFLIIGGALIATAAILYAKSRKNNAAR